METGTPSLTGDATRVFNAFPPPSHATLWTSLTPRERQLAEFLRRDAQAKEIADALGTSVFTVRNQIRGLYTKLGVHTRTAALIALGFLTPPRCRSRTRQKHPRASPALTS